MSFSHLKKCNQSSSLVLFQKEKKGHATPPSRFHQKLFLVFYHMYFYRLGSFQCHVKKC